MDALKAEIMVKRAMRDYARTLEESDNPDVIIAAATEEKRFIQELEQLNRQQTRATARASGR